MSNNRKKIIAIIQARIGSTRLPGKVLMKINGIPLLGMMLSRVSKSELLDKFIVATSNEIIDNKIEVFCKDHNYNYYRGSENDVLLRYYECAKKYNADIVVRLTADCPLIDPIIIDKVISFYIEKNVDYVANTVPPETNTFPDGSDVEIFSFEALKRAHQEAVSLKDREHVTFYFWKKNNGFKTEQLKQKNDWSNYRITVDYIEDLKVIEKIMNKLKQKNSVGNLSEIISIIENNPDIKSLNSKYYQGINW